MSKARPEGVVGPFYEETRPEVWPYDSRLQHEQRWRADLNAGKRVDPLSPLGTKLSHFFVDRPGCRTHAPDGGIEREAELENDIDLSELTAASGFRIIDPARAARDRKQRQRDRERLVRESRPKPFTRKQTACVLKEFDVGDWWAPLLCIDVIDLQSLKTPACNRSWLWLIEPADLAYGLCPPYVTRAVVLFAWRNLSRGHGGGPKLGVASMARLLLQPYALARSLESDADRRALRNLVRAWVRSRARLGTVLLETVQAASLRLTEAAERLPAAASF